ncbi:MAG: hypothetical protein ABIL58_23095 [Pseudomonadota bacterium]
MMGYTTTIGKAFEAAFDEPSWKTLSGGPGQRTVEFTGKISRNLHEAFVAHMVVTYSEEDIFTAAIASGYPPPPVGMPEDQYPKWQNGFLATLWAPGQTFVCQWEISRDTMVVADMSLDGNKIEDIDSAIAIICW